MNDRTAEAAMTVEEDGIRVEKSFTDDEFPVPAMTYELSSTREEAARVRIVDTIPESFPMDRVGFHPEYESDNWTAYKDHRVEFERVLEPGEHVETVFGIRSDDPDVDGFLGTPIIEHVPVGEEIEDVLGTGEADAVREVLSGDRATLPGMERTPAADEVGDDTDGPADTDQDDPGEGVVDTEVDAAAGTVEAPEPRRTNGETIAAVTRRSADPEPSPEADVEAEAEADVEAEAEAETKVDTVAAASATDEEGAAAPTGVENGIAAALAAEVRAGVVDDDDLALLRSELDVTVPRSVDVRIGRLQSSVADIEAYADALAEFIDDEGTAREVLDGLESRVDDVGSEVTALAERADDAAEERTSIAADVERVDGAVADVEQEVTRVEGSVEGLQGDVESVHEEVEDVETGIEDVRGEVGAVREEIDDVHEEVDDVSGSVTAVADDVSGLEAEMTGLDETVDDVGDDIETLYEGIDDVDAGMTAVDGRVDDVEDRLGRFDAEFDDVWDDLAEVDGRLTAVEDGLSDDLGDVESELSDIHDHLEELEAFRKRLNEAFGP